MNLLFGRGERAIYEVHKSRQDWEGDEAVPIYTAVWGGGVRIEHVFQ